jgi:hypothetical protein
MGADMSFYVFELGVKVGKGRAVELLNVDFRLPQWECDLSCGQFFVVVRE